MSPESVPKQPEAAVKSLELTPKQPEPVPGLSGCAGSETGAAGPKPQVSEADGQAAVLLAPAAPLEDGASDISFKEDGPDMSFKADIQTPKGEQMELFDDRLLTKKARLSHRLIGQLFETYWLVEYDKKLLSLTSMRP